ncbi:MAG: hypothetical protein JNK67_30030 [Alphaproteobacteria bacterium]|nr:hypothetical protein [Alphaproteobacteria bacterium]
MKRRMFLSLAAASATIALAGAAAAQSVPSTRLRRPYRDDLATLDERGDLDRSLRNARTDRERARIQSEYRTRMDERAASPAARNATPYQPPPGGWPDPNAANTPAVTGVPETAVPRRRAARVVR